MMDQSTDIHIESARIQRAIQNHLGIKDGGLIFEYRKKDNQVQLDLITINPRHNQSFLFHSETGYDKVSVLNKMLDYVTNYKENEGSYTLQWRIRGEKELHTSYFRARNMYDALDKLYYGRDMNTITVFSLTLNPLS